MVDVPGTPFRFVTVRLIVADMTGEDETKTSEGSTNDLQNRISNVGDNLERLECDHKSTERDVEAMKDVVDEIIDQMGTLVDKIEDIDNGEASPDSIETEEIDLRGFQ